MDKAKILKRLNNFNKVKGVIEIAKFDTIQKISKSTKIKDHYYESSKISQEIINFAKSKDKIRNLFHKKDTNKQESILWIYITLPTTLIRTSYISYENIIKDSFNKIEDKIITIGKPAKTFAQKNLYKSLAHFQNIDEASQTLSSIIIHEIYLGKIQRVKLVAQLNRLKNKPLTIYPFEETKFDKKKMKKMKFYYSLSDTIEQISLNYIKNTISGLYHEAYKNFYIEKLARHETSLKSIDAKIIELNNSLIKLERKSETEEMIQIIQAVKRR